MSSILQADRAELSTPKGREDALDLVIETQMKAARELASALGSLRGFDFEAAVFAYVLAKVVKQPHSLFFGSDAVRKLKHTLNKQARRDVAETLRHIRQQLQFDETSDI